MIQGRCMGMHIWSVPWQDPFSSVASPLVSCVDCGRVQAWYPANYSLKKDHYDEGELFQEVQQGWSLGGKGWAYAFAS
jgi:hypothetical protein